MTIQEALTDLMESENMEDRIAEDMFTRCKVYGDSSFEYQSVNVVAASSRQWITRDR